MTRSFPTLGVLGVTTGVLLKEKGFHEIHEVMDFFCPGIMTIGLCIMSKHVAKEIFKQYPELENLKLENPEENYKTFAKEMLEKFGETIELTTNIEMQKSLEKLIQ